jgi:uncharacterized membrane protein
MSIATLRGPLRPVALAIVMMAGWASVFLGAPPFVRVPLGVLCVALVPGDLLVSVLFGPGSLRPTLRLGLAVGLSAALQPLLGVLLNATRWGITERSATAALTCFCLPLAAGAAWRAARTSLPSPASPLRGASGATRLTGALVACGIVATGAAALYSAHTNFVRTPTTEFYVVGVGGQFGEYQATVRTEEWASVTLAVHNREGRPMRYTLTARPAASIAADLALSLAAGEVWRGAVDVRLPGATPSGSDAPVDLVLRVPGEPSDFRSVRLWLTAA